MQTPARERHLTDAVLGWPGGAAPAGLDYAAPVSCGVDTSGCAAPMSIEIDSAGDAIDRWWYVYLDQHRYQFLDRTQYNLLGGPSGWGWRYGTWPDVFLLPLPIRYTHAQAQPVPEAWTATLLALGALIVLRLRPPDRSHLPANR